jgi:hypothetical protein
MLSYKPFGFSEITEMALRNNRFQGKTVIPASEYNESRWRLMPGFHG